VHKFLRVNMNTKEVDFQEVKDDYTLFGGRGLIAKIMNEEVDPQCDPLGENNKLILCPGLLTGTMAPCSGRLSIGGKSPLTGTIKEANVGGVAAQLMAKLGLKAVIVEGKQDDDSLYMLIISKDGAELVPAGKYAGMNNYALAEALHADFGSKIGIVSIGCAGERGYRNSTIQVTDTAGNPSRAAARGGLGAVMGAKGLKAIILNVSGPSDSQYADKESFKTAAQNFTAGVRDNAFSGKVLPGFGTAALVTAVNAMGALPTNNFSTGSFERAEEISGERLAEIHSQRGGSNGHACQAGCVISCSNVYNDEQGNYLTSGLEYETIVLNGSNCGISSLDIIAKIDRMCDDLGLDTIETGATIGVCMEAGKIVFGDGEGSLRLLQEMTDGTEFGRLLGQGTELAGKALGVKRIPTVKGQSLAAYDPRSLKGTGVTYATSPMGADHTAGNTIGSRGVKPHLKEGQVEASTQAQVTMAALDNLGICLFTSTCLGKPENIGHLVSMVQAKVGGEWDADKLFATGITTLSMEKVFNKKAGFTEKDNTLPEFMYSESLPGSNNIFDILPDEMDKAIPF